MAAKSFFAIEKKKEKKRRKTNVLCAALMLWGNMRVRLGGNCRTRNVSVCALSVRFTSFVFCKYVCLMSVYFVLLRGN